jgi:hypothetical protein
VNGHRDLLTGFQINITLKTADKLLQIILTSSKLKSTPPIGAPKATETPAAAAADRISLFFASFRPYLGNKYDSMFPGDQRLTSHQNVCKQMTTQTSN